MFVFLGDADSHTTMLAHTCQARRMKNSLPRIGLAYLAALDFGLGAYASIAPRHFFLHFPPWPGHEWVAHDGPYNEHLVRDFGALNLALCVVAVCAVVWATRQLMIAAGLAHIVYAMPHAVYHLAHASRVGGTSDQVGAIGGLILNAVIGALLVLYAVQQRVPRETRPA
jgi:hypothetical protein